METFNFDQINVSVYDETRNTNPAKLKELLTYISSVHSPESYPNGIEIGVGTGRIAVPMAELGYHITGIDVSVEMTNILKQKIKEQQLNDAISIQMGSATQLPYPDNTFDFGLAVHVFHLIADWEKAIDELLRVVKNGNPIFLIFNNGKSLMKGIKSKYEQKCLKDNIDIKNLGTYNKEELLDYFVEVGCSCTLERGWWKWQNEVTYAGLLEILSARTYSFTTIAPDETHNCAIDEIKNELISENIDLNKTQVSVSELILVTVCKI
jgi:SAM-dependent methyltransferase